MGANDAREQLEVCKDEYGKLERENARLLAELATLTTGATEWAVLPDGDQLIEFGDAEEEARDWVARWPEDKLLSRRVATEWQEPR